MADTTMVTNTPTFQSISSSSDEAMDGLRGIVSNYAAKTDSDLIDRAFKFAEEVRPAESDPLHPIEVATILARMKFDQETIAGALLHEVITAGGVTREVLAQRFGERVALLVHGVTELERIHLTADDAKNQASQEKDRRDESLRKMFLAMVDDIGVVLIALANRLHVMRTLEQQPPDEQVRVAEQTMEIYASLANRIGIWPIKSELEDLSFRYLEPDTFAELKRSLDERDRGHTDYIEQVKVELKSALEEAGIKADLKGRVKHIYSIYRKMKKLGKSSIDEIYDVIGIRILVNETRDCYTALDVIQGKWPQIPGTEMGDYIAKPKRNDYQSLHTAVYGPNGRPLEFQIRTHKMHEVAEYGVASHWHYKEGRNHDPRSEAKIFWLRQLLDWRDEVKDDEEFVETLKSNAAPELIYCFTPKGDIFELPAGATPIDFAYRVHSEVGHHCIGAKVNGQLVRLNSELQNGQVVQILTSKNRGPSRDWLQEDAGYVTTASARDKIRRWFRFQDRDENILQGRDTLDRELRRLGLDVKPEEILKHFPRFTKLDDFLAAVGYGDVSSQAIASRLGENGAKDVISSTSHVPKPSTPQRLTVTGVGDLLTGLAQCCKPVSGDAIIGYVTHGRGIMVHRQDCPNVAGLDPERIVTVSWSDTGKGETFAVGIKITAWDRVGLLKDIAALLADERVNILHVSTTTHDDRTVALDVTLEVVDVGQLSRVLRKLESIQDIFEVRRDTSGASMRA